MAWLDCSAETGSGWQSSGRTQEEFVAQAAGVASLIGKQHRAQEDGLCKPPTHILMYWKHTSKGVMLTWVGKVHFWLHNHALRRQWGRAVSMGIDWSLELHCKISHWDSHKPSLFHSSYHMDKSPCPPNPLKDVLCFSCVENSNQTTTTTVRGQKEIQEAEVWSP